MKLNELREAWESIPNRPRSDEELRRMMDRSPLWVFGGFTRKDVRGFFLKALVVVAFCIVFNMFDGWFWGTVGVWYFLLLFDDHFGLRYLRTFPTEDTFRETIARGLARVKRIIIVTRALYVLVLMSLVWQILQTFLAGDERAIPMALMVIPFVAGYSWHYSKMWTKKTKELKELLVEFND